MACVAYKTYYGLKLYKGLNYIRFGWVELSGMIYYLTIIFKGQRCCLLVVESKRAAKLG